MLRAWPRYRPPRHANLHLIDIKPVFECSKSMLDKCRTHVPLLQLSRLDPVARLIEIKCADDLVEHVLLQQHIGPIAPVTTLHW